MKTSSNVTTQPAVSQHQWSVTEIIPVETGLTKTVVSVIFIISLYFNV